MTFYWFDLFRFFIALLLIGTSGWLLLRQEQKIRAGLSTPSFKGLVLRLLPALICIIVLIFSPIKLTVGEDAERTIKTFDAPEINQEIIIDRHGVNNYTPNSNEDEIDRITNQ